MFDLKNLAYYPKKAGVYLMKDHKERVLYVGKAKNLKERIKQYFVPGRDLREMVPVLVSKITDVETIVTSSEKEALLLENTLIKKHQPKYNALLKDDKTYVSLMINHKHPWPMVKLIRYKGKPPKDGLYFGPYTNAFAARQTLEALAQVFPLRQCSDRELASRKRPCLLYHIKRCIAPCVGKCTKHEYQEHVDDVINFLKGRDRKVLDQLKKKMAVASENMEYEKANSILKMIKRIEHIRDQNQSLVYSMKEDVDAFGFYRSGSNVMIMQLIFRDSRLIGSEQYYFNQSAQTDDEILTSLIMQIYEISPAPKMLLLPIGLKDKAILADLLSETAKHSVDLQVPKIGIKKKIVQLANENAVVSFEQEKHHLYSKEELLMDMQERFSLNRCPIRIECFDTSNIMGKDAVASMVAFTDGEKDSKRYRLFKINTTDQADDYSAMKEVLTRRYTKAKQEDDLPDLVIVDGGKGQLNIAVEVLQSLDIASVDIISLVKEQARHDKGLTKERIYIPNHKEPIIIDHKSSLLFFLQNIRDEAHRKAIGYHRKKRSQRTIQSSVDRIEGIGTIKKRRLFEHFKSIATMKAASIDELKKVKGLNKNDIDNILKWQKS